MQNNWSSIGGNLGGKVEGTGKTYTIFLYAKKTNSTLQHTSTRVIFVCIKMNYAQGCVGGLTVQTGILSVAGSVFLFVYHARYFLSVLSFSRFFFFILCLWHLKRKPTGFNIQDPRSHTTKKEQDYREKPIRLLFIWGEIRVKAKSSHNDGGNAVLQDPKIKGPLGI